LPNISRTKGRGVEIFKFHEKKITKDRVAMLAVSPSKVQLCGPVEEIAVGGILKEMYLRSTKSEFRASRLEQMYLRSPFKKGLS
jgi:hypothetical protein